MQQVELGTMAAQPSSMEFYEKRPLQEFRVSTRMFLPLRIINLQVDYDEGLWIVTLPPLDAAASSLDFQEARKMLLNTLTSYVMSMSCARWKIWARQARCKENCSWNYFR